MIKIKFPMFTRVFFGLILLSIIFIPTNSSFAAETKLPNWVFVVYEFWYDKEISDTELIDALNYLIEKDVIHLSLHGDYDFKSNFILTLLNQDYLQAKEDYCEDNWYITGYFLPVESDYNDREIMIHVEGQTKQYSLEFVNDVRIEGWGRTNDGDYLGWHSQSFHLSEIPLDAFGKELVVGKIAVDPRIIEFESKVVIPSLVEPWNEIVLQAEDVGGAIKGKHIDVYTGEGKAGEQETMRITGHNNSVCVLD